MSLQAELEAATTAARRAGALLAERFGGPARDVRFKDGDPRELVSQADLDADAAIRAVLTGAFPDDGILTEESPEASGPSGRRWVVDPLDGTTNFLHGIPCWSVSIALEDTEGEPLLGVVHDPVRDELFAGTGDGATRNGEPIAVHDVARIEEGLLSVLLKPEHAALPEVLAITTRMAGRELGSTALELAWVADGRLDGCLFRRNDNVWDWRGGTTLVTAAGGTVAAAAVPVPRATIAAGPTLAAALGA